MVHDNCQGHTGAMMPYGRGAAISFSNKQKINTNSSMDSKLVGANQALSFILHTWHFIEAQGYSVEQNLLFQDNQFTTCFKVNGSFSSSKCTKHIKCRYFFIRDKIANGNLKVLHCPTEIMWANVLTKLKQSRPFRLDRSHLMNVPINNDDNAKCLKTHPLLLPLDEHPIIHKQIKDQLHKTPIFYSRSVLGIKYPSPMKPVPGTPLLPITQVLTSNRSELTWADCVRISVATE